MASGVSAAPAAEFPTEMAPPSVTYQRLVEIGTAKAELPVGKIIILGLLAGVYVGLGALLMLHIGLNCPGLATTNPGLQRLVSGVFGLPFGLLMVLICGAELFTGNTCSVAAALYEGKASASQLLKSWIVSYTANLVGSIALVALVCVAGVAPSLSVTVGVAVKKSGLGFVQALARGVLANWLVNIAIWQATAATSLPGKVVGAVIPILTFVGIGLEHSVANMFFIPMAMALGAPITISDFLLGNLLPVTLGNIIGGAVCVAGIQSLVHGRAGNPAAA